MDLANFSEPSAAPAFCPSDGWHKEPWLVVEPRKKGKRYVSVHIGKRVDGMWYIADHEMGNYAMVSPHNMADIVWQFLEMCGIDPDDLKRFFKEQVEGKDYE